MIWDIDIDALFCKTLPDNFARLGTTQIWLKMYTLNFWSLELADLFYGSIVCGTNQILHTPKHTVK